MSRCLYEGSMAPRTSQKMDVVKHYCSRLLSPVITCAVQRPCELGAIESNALPAEQRIFPKIAYSPEQISSCDNVLVHCTSRTTARRKASSTWRPCSSCLHQSQNACTSASNANGQSDHIDMLQHHAVVLQFELLQHTKVAKELPHRRCIEAASYLDGMHMARLAH